MTAENGGKGAQICNNGCAKACVGGCYCAHNSSLLQIVGGRDAKACAGGWYLCTRLFTATDCCWQLLYVCHEGIASVGEGSYSQLDHGGSENETILKNVSALQGMLIVIHMRMQWTAPLIQLVEEMQACRQGGFVRTPLLASSVVIY